MWPTTPELRHWGVRVVAHDGALSCLVQNWLLLRRGELGWGCGTIWTCSTASCDVTIILKISKSLADRHLDQRACDLPHLFSTPAVILYTPAKATLPGTLARPTCNENNSLLTPSRSAWTSGTQFSTAVHFPTGRPSFPRDDEFNNSEYTETRVFDQQVQPATEKPGLALWNQSKDSARDPTRIVISTIRRRTKRINDPSMVHLQRITSDCRPSRE